MVSDATNDTAIGPSSHTSVMSPSKEHGIHGPLHLQQVRLFDDVAWFSTAKLEFVCSYPKYIVDIFASFLSPTWPHPGVYEERNKSLFFMRMFFAVTNMSFLDRSWSL
jgi:hypothetical protein